MRMPQKWQGSLWNESLSLVGERTDGHMKIQRLFLLLSVTILLLAGCGGKETQVTEEQSLETETQTAIDESEVISEESEAEESVTEEPEPETAEESEPEESASAEDSRSEDSGSKEQPSTEQKPEQEAQQPDEKPNEVAQPQPPQQEPEQQAEKEPEPVSYSPERVVQLATEKTKANGKIYIPDDLNRMLAEGTLSQEDYNACYPTDGAGYLEYYVATDLNEARDVSGTVNFNSEDDIAANIAGMYNSLPQQYFYIEYHGTVTYGGKECYVFYCYRA